MGLGPGAKRSCGSFRGHFTEIEGLRPSNTLRRFPGRLIDGSSEAFMRGEAPQYDGHLMAIIFLKIFTNLCQNSIKK